VVDPNAVGVATIAAAAVRPDSPFAGPTYDSIFKKMKCLYPPLTKGHMKAKTTSTDQYFFFQTQRMRRTNSTTSDLLYTDVPLSQRFV
jgi:hypothetical protein